MLSFSRKKRKRKSRRSQWSVARKRDLLDPGRRQPTSMPDSNVIISFITGIATLF
jgi:hypothetical protein